MSGMYMSEWPMFGTKDPNLGSSTDLLFDRDFIFGAFATCLIQGGYPVGATFERTGDILRDGVTFAADTPVVQGGEYHHNGQVTNKCLCDGLPTNNLAGLTISPLVDTIEIVDIGGVNFYCLTIGTVASGSVVDIAGTTGDTNPHSWHMEAFYENLSSGSFLAYLNFGEFEAISDSAGLVLQENIIPSSITRQLFLRSESANVGARLYFRLTQLTATKYDSAPIEVVSSRLATSSIDTAASQPNPDKHGLNWEFSDPKNGWAWDLLDGRADGVDVTPIRAEWDIDNSIGYLDGVYSFDEAVTGILLRKSGVISATDRYESCNNVTLDRGFYAISIIEVGESSPQPRSDTGTVIVRGNPEFGQLGYSSRGGTPAGFKGTIEPVYWKKISPATGTLNIKGLSVVPSVTEWQTTGDLNILSGATGNQIIYVESGTGLICATDGTNTTKSVQPYVAGQDHTVSLAFGDSKMQIYVDGVNGTQVPFVGTFTPGETLKWGLNNEDIFSKGNVCGQTTSSFSESVHLAEELAYDL